MSIVYPDTPDGRYFLAKGRLWRRSDPRLSDEAHAAHVKALMDARRAVKAAKAAGDEDALKRARRAVDAAKRHLGERGPVWWTDGAPDYTRRAPANTPYAAWAERLTAASDPNR